jgi:ribosome biogenesis GTPase
MTLTDWGWSPFFAAAFAPWGNSDFLPARVIRGEKNYFRVWSEAGEMTVRFAGKLRHQAAGRADLPVVGDWVVVERQPQQRGVIHALLPRASSFSRNLPGRRKSRGQERHEQQVIAANIDLIFIVSGLDRDFNLRRIERYLTLVSSSGAEAVILLNKVDLCAQPERYYRDAKTIAGTTPILLCTARDPEQLEPLQPYLKPGRTLAMLGSSGVGKSTLLNSLLGEQRQKTAALSTGDGKGRHTTSHRELFLLPGGAIMMDNPGMRELHLWGEQESLEESFADITELAHGCKFNDCRHRSEPSCAVRQAVKEGELTQERLSNYHKLITELDKTQARH